MAAVVAAPQYDPPQYGLLASAAAPPPGEDPRAWTRSITWRPETCGGYGQISQCSAADLDPPDPGPGAPAYEPWAVVVQDRCTTMSGRDDVEGRLRRRLQAVESYAIARELWDGALTQADDLDNPYLTEAGSEDRPLTVLNGGTAVKLSVAAGLLEEALGDCLHGARGMIHAPRSVALNYPGVERTGATWVTRNGNLLVGDAGYPGSAPDHEDAAAPGDTQRWIAATGLVTVRRHPEITVLPGDDTTGGVRTADNTRLYRAERLVAATYDPCCRLFVLVDLTA